MNASTASRQTLSGFFASRPARTRLVASRFTSHSHGPAIVSSKSLVSNTSAPVGDPYTPRLRTCASPQSWTVIPETGNCARSYAIIGTAPRKKPNGEAAIRVHFIGSNSRIRSTAAVTSRSTGLGRFFAGFHSHWSTRCTAFRRDLPCSRRPSGSRDAVAMGRDDTSDRDLHHRGHRGPRRFRQSLPMGTSVSSVVKPLYCYLC